MPSAGIPTFLDGMWISVAQLKALSISAPDNISAGDVRLVKDATWGAHIYEFTEDATAESAPTYYRSNEDSGVWKQIS